MKYLSLFNPSIYIVAAIIKHGQNLNMSKNSHNKATLKLDFMTSGHSIKKFFFLRKRATYKHSSIFHVFLCQLLCIVCIETLDIGLMANKNSESAYFAVAKFLPFLVSVRFLIFKPLKSADSHSKSFIWWRFIPPKNRRIS